MSWGQPAALAEFPANSPFLGIAIPKDVRISQQVLAEPTLVARSGQRANFLAGGEVPLLEPSGLGTVAVKLKPFGVGIDFRSASVM